MVRAPLRATGQLGPRDSPGARGARSPLQSRAPHQAGTSPRVEFLWA